MLRVEGRNVSRGWAQREFPNRENEERPTLCKKQNRKGQATPEFLLGSGRATRGHSIVAALNEELFGCGWLEGVAGRIAAEGVHADELVID